MVLRISFQCKRFREAKNENVFIKEKAAAGNESVFIKRKSGSKMKTFSLLYLLTSYAFCGIIIV